MKNTLPLTLLFLFLFSASQNLLAQRIYTDFLNPSFEDIARYKGSLNYWKDCGLASETPPAFNIVQSAYHGNNFIGMVVRDNNTYKAVSQKLDIPLKANQCYAFNLYLSVSEEEDSSNENINDANFDTPMVLKVWGANSLCDKGELLAVSHLVKHHQWKNYEFQLSPKQRTKHIILEASFHKGLDTKNGHILLDDISPIYSFDCKDFVSSIFLLEQSNFSPVERLERTIFDYGGDIHFNKKNELTRTSKKKLTSIIESIQLVENIELVFCLRVKRKDKFTLEKRIKELESVIGEMGLDKKKYYIRKYERKSDKDTYWFSDNSDLLIGLNDT